jgi:hypothetical protein
MMQQMEQYKAQQASAGGEAGAFQPLADFPLSESITGNAASGEVIDQDLIDLDNIIPNEGVEVGNEN